MKKSIFIIAGILSLTYADAQVSFGKMQNMIPRSKEGLNVFDVKKDDVPFDGLSVDVGGAFAMQFQGLNSFNDQKEGAYTLPNGATIYGAAGTTGYRLNNLGNNFNLPAANFTLGAQLADGVRVNLDIYLSSRHHNETWVKGGYLQIDKLDFIKKGFMEDIMKYTTIKIGQMENNYGDSHFRRTDNGNALLNPFIEANIMDSFETEMGMEVYYNRDGLVSMVGITNGKLNQGVAEFVPSAATPTAPDPNTTVSPTILAKLGYDKQLNQDLRVRITGSYNHNANMSANPWGSDRAGSRYFGVMSHQAYTYDSNGNAPGGDNVQANNFDPAANATTGRFSPGYANWYTAFMINPFIKYKGLEFFGTLEFTSGGDKKGTDDSRSVDQYAADLVYRFGPTNQFYVGARYNIVSGELSGAPQKVDVERFETSAGWFMTKNIIAKLAYTNQNYSKYSQFSGNSLNDLYGGSFNGLMFEAAITF
ncbi:hypothetical protein [Flavobacterium gilvum]|uniref:Porin n=1 Tax=Flavobacterium gilvum TaxID=1492737 RepID=A0AAC9I2V9_9FLAO|nr:hypothetical protein [Flavobacterium gilvum]AOW09259.1 hypothetical protein EM308_06920 [Flavobacterium gilvum]KFC60133.1 hypothetical protein FEM08_11340 [Flavobacterium gilvum]